MFLVIPATLLGHLVRYAFSVSADTFLNAVIACRHQETNA
jgi:hypothetical protein